MQCLGKAIGKATELNINSFNSAKGPPVSKSFNFFDNFQKIYRISCKNG
jgi:methylmalonyl-CoA mutase N-terminal domain/subunit